MTEYKIYPICLGTTVRGVNHDIVNPLIAYYVTDGMRKILIDTGGIPADGVSWMPYYQKPDETLDKKLPALGVKPEEIDMVILTHLHWDHAANNHLFTNAEFYVQKEELIYAIDPLPIHAAGYDAERIFMTKYHILYGDEEIIEGISVLLVPGHTSGSQCVLVNTADGIYAVTGDFINKFSDWTSNPRLPASIHTDLIAYFNSFKKLEKACDHILPGHDALVLEHEVYPY